MVLVVYFLSLFIYSLFLVRNVEAPPFNISLKQRSVLKGHFGKIYAMHWATADNSKYLVSASQVCLYIFNFKVAPRA